MSSQKVINLLAQNVYCVDQVGRVIEKFETDHDVAKALKNATAEMVPSKKFDKLPVKTAELTGFEAMPKEKDGTFYLVTETIKDNLPERKDLLKLSQVDRYRGAHIYDGKQKIKVDGQNLAFQAFIQ